MSLIMLPCLGLGETPPPSPPPLFTIILFMVAFLSKGLGPEGEVPLLLLVPGVPKVWSLTQFRFAFYIQESAKKVGAKKNNLLLNKGSLL